MSYIHVIHYIIIIYYIIVIYFTAANILREIRHKLPVFDIIMENQQISGPVAIRLPPENIAGLQKTLF